MKASLMAAVWAPLALSACAPADHFLFHDAFAEGTFCESAKFLATGRVVSLLPGEIDQRF